MPKQYLTVKEIAKLFGVTPLTIRNWDKKGSLAAYRNPVNNYRMYKVEEVESLFKQIEDSKSIYRPATAIVEDKPKPPRKLTIETE